LKFKTKVPRSTARRPKSQKKAQECHLEEAKTARTTKARKAANQAKWQRRAKKSSKPKQNEQEKLKLKNFPRIKLSLTN
jgi:hypothetical protein